MKLELQELSCGYTQRPILSKVNATLESGDFVCLLGRNGSGKSSLLKTLAGILKPLEGAILAEGKRFSELSSAERAACLAFVPQAHAPVFAFKVLDLVAMGRTARRGLWQSPGRSDWEAAERALADIGLEAYSDKSYTALSGGERQLVMIARALAQEARILVLDEPASSLDFGNQVRVLRCLTRLSDKGLSILMATHHPDHALRFASGVWLVHDGHLEAAGDPEHVITPERLGALYGTPFTIAELRQPGQNTLRTCLPCL